MEDILNKIKDPKLRELLNVYRTTNNVFGLIDIMDYFDMKYRVDAFEALFPKFEVEKIGQNCYRIYLGGFIIHSQLYGVFLDITDKELTLHLETQYYILIKRENKPKSGGDINVK
jgi:hypothetical protein